MSPSLTTAVSELSWLKDHPEFAQRPATLLEFLGPDYLDIADGVRPAVREVLADIMGHEVNARKPTQYEKAIFTGAIGIGKGLPVFELVATPKGWKVIGSLVAGDEVIGSDGRPTRVEGVYPRGRLPVYKVSFSDGSSIRVDGDHLWQVSRRQGQDHHWVTSVMSTDELRETKLRGARGTFHYRIPIVEPVQYEAGPPLPIQPYLLGLLLGDGSFTHNVVRLSGDDHEVARFIDLPSPVRMYRNPVNREWRFITSPHSAPNPLTQALRNLGLFGLRSHDKFVPDEYMFASAEDRLELVRGLMDSDGSQSGSNRQTFANSNLDLCHQLVELVQSLGGVARIASWERPVTGTEYTVSVNLGSVCPFNLTRKASKWQPRTRNIPCRGIASIEPDGEEDVVCIKVAAEDGLFVARDYIVTHNTTVASIVLPYLVHWVLCLKDPQGFFGLLPGSRIAFMMMSTKATQAREVLFSDIKARLQHSPWFRAYPPDPKFKNQIRFDGDIWILPGDSQETTFEGYNILGGILDEADSHKLTDEKCYATQGWETIYNRMSSRFGDRGFVLTIGQMKSQSGFAARQFDEFSEADDSYASRMTIWESRGDEFFRDPTDGQIHKFWYDPTRKIIVPDEMIGALSSIEHLLHIPELYRQQFTINPEKAMKDLAGLPPKVESPFISLVDRIHACRQRWIDSHGPTGPVDSDNRIRADFRSADPLIRVAHLDIAYSGTNGDGLGIAMGHIPWMVEVDGELKPYIVIDFLYRMKARPGSEVFLGDARQVIYNLKRDRGFRLRTVTMDGFQSVDTRQQLARRRIHTYELSVDKEKAPYEELREAIYEGRIEFPPYLVRRKIGDVHETDVLVAELEELVDNGKKIDHPKGGSKDVADAVAAVVANLMGNTRYHRQQVGSSDMYTPLESQFTQHRIHTGINPLMEHPAFLGRDVRAPEAPRIEMPPHG